MKAKSHRNIVARIALLLVIIGLSLPVSGQVSGIVTDAATQDAMPGALVRHLDGTAGAYTDEDGKFSLPALPTNAQLTVSFAGYLTDTLPLPEPGQPLNIGIHSRSQETVVITGTMKPTYISRSPIKVEVLTREFLRALPGNSNIMEVIDYVNGVRQQINCGVCGTNDIHINGMEGPYTLVLIDGMPIISALGSVYGLNGISSSMIERIEIIKGPASTLYGAEAVAGIINIITRDPGNVPLVSAEAYGTSHGEMNADFSVAPTMKKKVHTLLSGNYYGLQNRIDYNNDNFTDIPLSQRISLFNKWTIDRPDHRIASIAAKVYYEDRFGGVMQWQPEDRGSDQVYGESITTKRAEIIGSYQLPFAQEKVRLDFSFAHHDQESYYGDSYFGAVQTVGFANLLWYKDLGRHELLLGGTARYNYYDDSTPATEKEASKKLVPGIFVQDEYKVNEKLTTLLGLRYDFDPDHGGIFSPRVNFKWNPATFSTLRATAGTGFRNVNIFTEEHAALTGARQVVIEDDLAPERSYNANLNLNQVVNIGESAVNLDFDVFFTYFRNRILPDYDIDENLIVYRNLDGHSIIRGASLKYSQSFTFPLRVEAGATFMQVYSVDNGTGLRNKQPFAPSLDGVFSLSYQLKKLHSTIDYTGRVVGPMQLPTFSAPFARPNRSDWFTVQNVQVSTTLAKGFSLQLGCRNLLNYTQDSPLINPGAPFSDEFDTAYAYGPLQPRRVILGLRWQLDRVAGK